MAYPKGDVVTGKSLSGVIVDDAMTGSVGCDIQRDTLKAWYLGYEAPTKEQDMIGGNTCHLCGARMKTSGMHKRYKKNGCIKDEYEYRTYRCGTEVTTENGSPWKLESVGAKCIHDPDKVGF